MRRPAAWLALLPLLLVPCCWLWWWAATHHPGLEPGRSAALVLAVLAALPLLWRRDLVLPAATAPLLLALAWQGLAQSWSPVPGLGMLVVAERLGALAAAVGLLLWVRRQPDARLPTACGIAGLLVLAMTMATDRTLGLDLAIGKHAPLGLSNYSVHFAMPLLGVGLVYALRTSRLRAVIFAVLGGGLAIGFGLGWLLEDPCRAALVCLAGLAAASLVLAAPARWHAPLLAAGGALLLAGWIASFTGLLDPATLGWSTAQRIHIWRGACEALAGPQLAVGYGPAACIAVLPEQPSFAAIWLTVPSWPTHPHNELLNILLEGGLVLAGLLAVALWRTIAPLWRRRDDPFCAALLVGWITAGCGALIEGHLHEPGGLLLLAILAGLSWAQAPAPTAQPAAAPAWLLPLPALALALCIVHELAGDGGPPVSIHRRACLRLERIPASDQAAVLAELTTLRQRLGPLDGLDYDLAMAYGRLGRVAESIDPLLGQLRRLPVSAPALAQAARFRAARAAPPELLAAEAKAREAARRWLELVPENARNAERRRELSRVLAGDGPAPAP